MTDPTGPLPTWANTFTQMVDDARTVYGPDALCDGSVVVVLLDDEQQMTGRTLIRSANPALGAQERDGLLGEAVHVLRHGHHTGAAASQCLLVTGGHGSRPAAADDPWRAALERTCASADLRAVDVLGLDPAPPVLPL